MPITGDGERKLEQIGKSLGELGSRGSPAQERMLTPVKQEIKTLLRDEFSKSIGPTGESWQETVRGRAALVSKKLPYAFDFGIRDGVVVGVGKTKRDLLDAHQEGHTFRERQVAAQQQFLTFDKNGKLIRKARALNKKGEARRGVYQTFARAHTIGERVLPQRQIIPEGSELPKPWDDAVERGLSKGMEQWSERVEK